MQTHVCKLGNIAVSVDSFCPLVIQNDVWSHNVVINENLNQKVDNRKYK